MIFIDNKYTNIYYRIIKRAIARSNIKSYVEKHHIIPRSLGGNNSKSNIAILTGREHYICHMLLIKMTNGPHQQKMKFALAMMTNSSRIDKYMPKSSSYEFARKSHKEALSEVWTVERRAQHAEKIRKITKGRKHSQETIENMKNKVWSEKAIKTRLENCLRGAARRKGKKNPDHGKKIFENYVNNNKDFILEVWKLFDSGLNKRQISLQMGAGYDRVRIAVNKRKEIELITLVLNGKYL